MSIAWQGGLGLDFSPDGKFVALGHSAGSATTSNVVTVQPDGQGLRARTSTNGAAFPIWSPDGGKLAYISNPMGAISNISMSGYIEVYDMATKRTRRFVGQYELPMVWREDGRRLACLRRTPDGQSEVVQLNAVEGGVINHFVAPIARGADYKMVWLPNTDNVAFLADIGGKSDVWTMEDGEPHQITKTGDVIGMNLSADKKSLLWIRRGPNLKYILLSMYAYNLEKRSVARVTFPERLPALNPDPRTAPSSLNYAALSPTGRGFLLTVTTTVPPDPKKKLPGSNTLDCYLVAMDGSSAKRVRQIKQEDGASIVPFWSHSGQFALTIASGKNRKVELYDAQGALVSTLATTVVQ
jgi:WD40 repeat protein